MLDLLFSLLAPFECLDCGHEGRIVCTSCLLKFPEATARCHLCQNPSLKGLTCFGCRPKASLERLTSFTTHESLAKDLVWKVKSNGALAGGKIMAQAIAKRLEHLPRKLIITSAPTTNSRVRQRGYDQSTLIAKELAKITGLKYQKTLMRIGSVHQVGASRGQRLSQLNSQFQALNPQKIFGKSYLIVDDVTTTGATLRAAAWALSMAGAVHVQAATFSQA